MRKTTFFKSLLLLCALIVGSSAWATTKTEGFEKKNAATTYNSTVTVTTAESDCGIAWSMYYGTVSTNDKISGNNSAQMRWYASATSNIPYIKTTTAIEGLSNVALKARTSSLDVKMDVCYSEDGETWIVGKTHTFIATGKGENVSLDIPSGNQYVKFEVSSSSTAPSSGNYKLIVDDVVFTYTAGSEAPTCAAPTFSPAEGAYIDTQNVTISCETEGATIYYTTDGNDPTTESTVYSTPIEVSANTTIKAFAAKKDYTSSSIVSATYTFPTTTYNSIADLKAATLTGTVILNLTDAQVLGKGTDDMYVKDATGALDLYKLGLTYTAGQILNGKVVVEKTTTYNGMFEITAIGENQLVATEGALPTPTVLANASDATLADYEWQFVTVTGTATDTRKIDGLLVYKALMNFSNFIKDVDNLTATGLIVPFKSGDDIVPELLPTSIICHITLNKDMVTYCSNNKLNFTGTGLTVYSAKVDGGVAKLTEIENAKVTNGKGIILVGTAGQTYDVPFNTGSSTSISNNELLGVVAETAVAYSVDSKYNYILQDGVFKKATGKKLKAGKAYLSTAYDVTGATGAARLQIVIDGEPTGIANVSSQMEDVKGIFNLQGQRVEKAQKGLYIMNGKKILVK